jgi:acyl dehydratase
MDQGQGQMEASMVKLFTCRTAEWLTREAMQIHGGMGYAEETAVSRYFLDARVLSIFEGAEETLALKVIARSLIDAVRRRAAAPDAPRVEIADRRSCHVASCSFSTAGRTGGRWGGPGAVRHPHYGRYLEEFVPGQVFVHPRGFTFLRAQMEAFARTYMQCNPLYLNEEFARASGFAGLLASPQMVFNVVLSLGVQNDSEKAMANLGYYDAQYLRPVHALDTIRSLTKVIDRKERGAGKPGIVTIRTLGINQHDEVVLQYETQDHGGRAGQPPADDALATVGGGMPAFPWVDDAEVFLPAFPARSLPQAHRPHFLLRGFHGRRDHRPCQRPDDHRRASATDLCGGQHASAALRPRLQFRPVRQDER